MCVHAFFGCERAACDLTLFAQTLFINTTLIPFEIYNVSWDWAYIIPYNDQNPNLVMASHIEEAILAVNQKYKTKPFKVESGGL